VNDCRLGCFFDQAVSHQKKVHQPGRMMSRSEMVLMSQNGMLKRNKSRISVLFFSMIEKSDRAEMI